MITETPPTQALARYTSQLAYEDIPSEVTDRLRLHLLDATGAALFGWTLPWTQMINDVLSRWGGVAESRVWSSALMLPAAHAAFVNSVATHAFELDDRRVAAYMHPASATLPTALSIADRLGRVSGRATVTAIVAGYEVGLRIGRSTSRGAFARGFYSPGLGGAFAATATAASLLGLNEAQTAAAMNLCATQASGLYSPTMMKRFNLGRGTYNGVLAAELALAGFSGVDDVLENPVGGFCKAFSDEPGHDLLAGLGQDYETLKVELKPYVSSRPNHTAIDCILDLKDQHPRLSVDTVESMVISVSTANYRFGGGFAVDSVPAALMSVAYCVAVALNDGDAFLEQFTEERVRDPRLQALLDRITVIPDPAFDELGLEERDTTSVACTLRDGTELSIRKSNAKGHPDNPLSDQDVLTKFRRLLEGRVAAERQQEIEDLVLNLDELHDVSTLSAVLSQSG